MPNLLRAFAAVACLACASTPLPRASDLPDAQVEICQTTPIFYEPSVVDSYWEPETFPIPGDELIRSWYSAELCAMGEAPMTRPAASGSTRFRFLWIRSFDPPISIRIENDGLRTLLFAVQLESPREDYAPGSVTRRESRELSPKEWEEFSRVLDRVRLWDSKSEPHTCCDGAQWIFEIAEPDRYHVVDLLSGGDLRALGEATLSLSGLDPGDIY